MASSSKHAAPRKARSSLLRLGLTGLGLAGVALVIHASRPGPAQTARAPISAEQPSAEPGDLPEESGPAAEPSHAHQQGEPPEPPGPNGLERAGNEGRVVEPSNIKPIDTGRQGLVARCDQGDVPSCRQLGDGREDLLEAHAAELRALELEACAGPSNHPCVARSRSELRLAAAERVAAMARERGDPCGGNPMCFRVSGVAPAAEKVMRIPSEPVAPPEQVTDPRNAPVCNQEPCWTPRALARALHDCEFGNGRACWQLHRAYQGGRGVPADPAKAAEYEQKAVRARAIQPR